MDTRTSRINRHRGAKDQLCVPHKFTFGHVRQFERVIGEALAGAWALGAGPGDGRLVVDIDSTIEEVHGKKKHGAAYGYTKKLGYHPILATWAAIGEILHARLRKGSANTERGIKRFVEELVARLRRAGATGPIVMRFDVMKERSAAPV
jgi:Transposase DDE domain group 1